MTSLTRRQSFRLLAAGALATAAPALVEAAAPASHGLPDWLPLSMVASWLQLTADEQAALRDDDFFKRFFAAYNNATPNTQRWVRHELQRMAAERGVS